MKTTIWANCPKCKTELKIETDEPELVQIECPDCSKVFAAKVPPRSAAPLHDVFSQMPLKPTGHAAAQMPALPPFQPAHVHYKSRPKSDDSMSPAVLTALIFVCASAILLPLGFGGYYFYSQLSESSQIAMNGTANSTPPTSTPSTSASSQSSFAATPASGPSEPAPSSKDFSAQAPTGRKTPLPSEAVDANMSSPAQPQPGSMTPADANTSPDADSKIFGVPELNPPMIVQPDPFDSQVAPPSNQSTSSPSTPNPPTTSNPTPFGNSNVSQGQISVAGAGMSKSGLPVQLHRFVGANGVLIFVLHSKGHSVANSIQELQRTLSIPDIHTDGGSDYTTVGIRYSGSVDSVAKGIRFGRVSFIDEESRSIHVQAN